MRIAFDAKRAFFNRSGLGTYSRGVINAMSKYFPVNDYFLFNKEASDTIVGDNIKIVTPQRELDRTFPSIWRSYWSSGQIHQLKPNIYHGLSNEIPMGINKQIKTVVTIHDLLFLKKPQWYTGIDRAIYQAKVAYSTRRASHIIAVSEQTKQDLLHHYKQIEESQITVIPPPISERFHDNYSQEQISKIRSAYNLPDNFILSLGTIEKRKNLGALIKALVEFEAEIPLVIIGKKTNYWNEIASTLSNYKAGFHLLTDISDEQIPLFMNAAKMLVNLSLDEGFGMQNIEAMMCGTPVLLSNTPVFKEVVGDAALFVNPIESESIINGIEKIYNQEELRSKLSDAGKKLSEKYSMKHVAHQLNDLYTQICYDQSGN